MTIKGVAFDMDGVLAQSMERHYEAYRTVLGEHGVHIEPHDVYAREGQKAPQVVRFLAKGNGLDLSEEELDAMARKKQEIFSEFGKLPLYPGVADLVRALADAGVPMTVVTGTWRKNAERHLAEIVDLFTSITSADDVTHTKPHPEPYLTAFEHMGVKPEEAVVVENAVLGIQSAQEAGAGTIVGVMSTLTAEELAGAHVVVPDIPALADWFRRQGVIG